MIEIKKVFILFLLSYIISGCTTTPIKNSENQYSERNKPMMQDNVKEWKEWEQKQQLKKLKQPN